jgi:2'-5' RNA ligase
VRLFLAINLEPDVRRTILQATEPLHVAGPSLGWVDESRLHLTLKFLGEAPSDAVAPLSDAIDRVASRHRPFTMRIADVGAFPNFRRARVVWMGIDREPKLELLHHDIELACEQQGYEVEGRPFRPHLTLARVKDRPGIDELRNLSRASKSVELAEESVVTSIDLMLSRPGPGGSRYECLHAARLGRD